MKLQKGATQLEKLATPCSVAKPSCVKQNTASIQTRLTLCLIGHPRVSNASFIT